MLSGYLNFRCLSMKVGGRPQKEGNLFLTMEIDYGMSSFIAKNKLPALKPNLHTQASEIQVQNNYTFFAVYKAMHKQADHFTLIILSKFRPIRTIINAYLVPTNFKNDLPKWSHWPHSLVEMRNHMWVKMTALFLQYTRRLKHRNFRSIIKAKAKNPGTPLLYVNNIVTNNHKNTKAQSLLIKMMFP